MCMSDFLFFRKKYTLFLKYKIVQQQNKHSEIIVKLVFKSYTVQHTIHSNINLQVNSVKTKHENSHVEQLSSPVYFSVKNDQRFEPSPTAVVDCRLTNCSKFFIELI